MKSSSPRKVTQIFLSWLTFLPVASVLLYGISAAEAKEVTATFKVDIDSGSLLGERFSGSLNYDDSNLFGNGPEYATLSVFSFDFNGSNFYLQDALNPSPEVEFLNGEITGLFYVSEQFSFEIDFWGEQFFAYAGLPASGGDGFGDVEFTVVSSPPTAVPEPSMIVAFIPSLLTLKWLATGKRPFIS